MPTDDNPAENHLNWHRSMTGVPVEPKADAAPAPVSRRDNMTSGATPVLGSGTAAEIEATLNNRCDSRRR